MKDRLRQAGRQALPRKGCSYHREGVALSPSGPVALALAVLSGYQLCLILLHPVLLNPVITLASKSKVLMSNYPVMGGK